MQPLPLALLLAGLAGTVCLLSLSPDKVPARQPVVRRALVPQVQAVAAAPDMAATSAAPLPWALPVAPPQPAVVIEVTTPEVWIGGRGRPPEELRMSEWAARDPEGAGHWLNLNRSHPHFADMVRGYAIQAATIDPAAARQWAALLGGRGNVFSRGGTLEQHIDAIEAMLRGPQPSDSGPGSPHASPPPMLFADYRPALVRPAPGAEPVLEMVPVDPFP